MLRSPERSLISAALTPSRAALPSVQIAPEAVGSAPATARSSVLLPEPLWPITPIDSPWWATKEMPRTARTTSTAPTCPRSRCARRPPYVL